MRHGIRVLLTAAVLTGAFVLSSCSGLPRRDRLSTRLHHYETRAGKPVSKLVWRTDYKRLSPLASNKLLVWTNTNRAYLMTVFQPCTDLMNARHIGLTSTIDTVRARTDFVVADGWRCMIRTIQPIHDPGTYGSSSVQR